MQMQWEHCGDEATLRCPLTREVLVFVEKLIGGHCNVVSAYRCSLTRGRVKLCQKSRENDAKRLMEKSSLPSFFASEGKNKNNQRLQ